MMPLRVRSSIWPCLPSLQAGGNLLSDTVMAEKRIGCTTAVDTRIWADKYFSEKRATFVSTEVLGDEHRLGLRVYANANTFFVVALG